MVEQVSIKPVNGRKLTIYLEISKDNDQWLTGREVDKEGITKSHIHVINKSAITKRVPVTMNNKYGWFEATK